MKRGSVQHFRQLRWRASLALACSVLFLFACGRSTQLRGRVASLHHLADEAEDNGAMECAPRALALTRAYTEFAELELSKGSVSKAEDFVRRAELNADAAHLMSPPERCTDEPAPVEAKPTPGDRDGDGFLDTVDECPDEAEIFQAFEDMDGCPDDPDTDGDGVVDSLDACVLLPEDPDGYLDDDGCPDPDNDSDLVLDDQDACPNDPEDPDSYEDADGCPDLDNDGDGVADLDDECPITPGQADEAPLGCPLEPALVVVTDCEVKITQQIHFATNKAIIKRESYPILEAVLEVLEKNESIKLQVQGHTDSKGSDAYNMRLSEQRAAAVRKHLVSRGVSVDRLTSQGFGEERPIVDNETPENRALNRRVQFMRTEGRKDGCNDPEPAKEPRTE